MYSYEAMNTSSVNSNLKSITVLILLACNILASVQVTKRDQAILTTGIRVTGKEEEVYFPQQRQDAEERQDSIEFAPIIINAGQGTTGTHLFTEATCLLGYTSLHYNLGCIPSRYLVPKATNRTTTTEIAIEFDERFQSDIIGQHYYLLAKLNALNRIDFSNNGKSFLIRAQKVLEDLIINAKAINIVLSLHDTPYLFLLPYIIKFTKKHHDGKSPLIILSERDPEEYISRRTSTNQGDSHIMCRQTLKHTSSYNNGSFDILGCIDQAVKTNEESSNFNSDEKNDENRHRYTLFEGDLLISMNNATKKFGIDRVVESYRDYQYSARQLATFSYNIFHRKERTNAKDLARLMKQKFERYYPPEKVVLMNVNLLKKTLIEKII